MLKHLLRCGTLLAFSLLAQAACAQNSLFPPPAALKLMNNAPGSAMPGANWTIWQFSAPTVFKSFSGNKASSANGWVTMGGPGSFQMQATAARLPCKMTYPSGLTAVREYDELATPDRPKGIGSVSIAQLHHVIVSGNIYALATGPFDEACQMNVVSVVHALDVTNPKKGQDLGYQIKIGQFAAGPSGPIHAVTVPPDTGWFSTGTNQQTSTKNYFGYNDAIDVTYHHDLLKNGGNMRYSIDILPKLKAIIADGAKYGIDQNLNDWSLTGEYLGPALYGHVAVETHWSDLSVVEN